MTKYMTEHRDNHNIPQYKFISDENDVLYPQIKILRTESLTKDMKEYGYKDFNGKNSSTSYDKYLCAESIQLLMKFTKLILKCLNIK